LSQDGARPPPAISFVDGLLREAAAAGLAILGHEV
jgi:hypothetical protein